MREQLPGPAREFTSNIKSADEPGSCDVGCGVGVRQFGGSISGWGIVPLQRRSQ
jgi:hypothetical protein